MDQVCCRAGRKQFEGVRESCLEETVWIAGGLYDRGVECVTVRGKTKEFEVMGMGGEKNCWVGDMRADVYSIDVDIDGKIKPFWILGRV